MNMKMNDWVKFESPFGEFNGNANEEIDLATVETEKLEAMFEEYSMRTHVAENEEEMAEIDRISDIIESELGSRK